METLDSKVRLDLRDLRVNLVNREMLVKMAKMVNLDRMVNVEAQVCVIKLENSHCGTIGISKEGLVVIGKCEKTNLIVILFQYYIGRISPVLTLAYFITATFCFY